MPFLYNLLQVLFLLLLFPLWVGLPLFHKRLRKGLAERLGISESLKEPIASPSLWVHAASLGEVKVSAPICEALEEMFPAYDLIFTASTPVGKKQARALIKNARKIFLLPLDFFWVVCPVVAKCRPAFFLVAETELWPNLFFCMKRRGVRIALFNGRISDKSYKRYKTFRFFFRHVLECVELFLVQTEEDARRMAALGAPDDRIRVTGNVKFDAPYAPMPESEAEALRVSLNMTREDTVWVAGSIHPEELPPLLDAFRGVKEEFPEMKWIVIPRHLYALPRFEETLRSRGLSYAIWDGRKDVEETWEILLVNALGQLIRLYQLGTAAFVGGSLAPVGGHNLLEPIRYGAPTLFGPRMENFREIKEIVIKEAVAFEVSNARELSDTLRRLLGDPVLREEIRVRCHKLFEKYHGATERSIQHLEAWIRAHGTPYKGD